MSDTPAPDAPRPGQRQLIAMITGEGKTPEELKAAALLAIQKWQDAQPPPL